MWTHPYGVRKSWGVRFSIERRTPTECEKININVKQYIFHYFSSIAIFIKEKAMAIKSYTTEQLKKMESETDYERLAKDDRR
jgi:hypothetical protein